MPVVDTLRLKTRLSESGMPETQVLVEELDEVLSTAITAQVATKADVAGLKAGLDGCATKADMAELKSELKIQRWVGGVILTIVIGIGIRLLFM